MSVIESRTPFIDRCEDLYHASSFYQRGDGRPLAFLVDFRRYSWLKREAVESGLVEPSPWRPVPQSLHGFNLYVGPWAPPDGVLFLPEETIRSMVGLWD